MGMSIRTSRNTRVYLPWWAAAVVGVARLVSLTVVMTVYALILIGRWVSQKLS